MVATLTPRQFFLTRDFARVLFRNERFRGFCVSLAQQLWRTEIRLRENLLGEKHHNPRPLSENK